MCQPELKSPSVANVTMRSRTTFVSATTVLVVAAIAMPAPIAPPSTNAVRTIHFFDRSTCIAPPLPVDIRGVEAAADHKVLRGLANLCLQALRDEIKEILAPRRAVTP